MIPSKVYSKALYELAEEIDKNEGCVTCSSVLVEGAAERIDMQTMTIRGLEIQRDELLAVLEKFIAWNKAYPSSRIYSAPAIRVIAKELDQIAEQAEAASASAKGINPVVKESLTTETYVPAIVFYPAGSLGEEVQP